MPSDKSFHLWFTFLLGISSALLISRLVPQEKSTLSPKSDTSAQTPSGSSSATTSTAPDSTKPVKSQRESSTKPKHPYLSADDAEQAFRRLLANAPSQARLIEILKLTHSLSAEVMLEFIDQDRWEFLRAGLTEQEANVIGDALQSSLRRDGTKAQLIFLLNHGDSAFFPFAGSDLAEGMTRVMDAREAYDAIANGNLSEKQQEKLRQRTAYAFGEINPQQFLSLAYEKEGQKILSANGSDFLKAWIYKSPEQAIQWTLALAQNSEDEQALKKFLIREAMSNWTYGDTYQATKWLAARPRDENTDRLTSILATSLLSSSEYDSAKSWADTIQDEAMRKETLDQIHSHIELWRKIKQK
jgi:hypothetical protein